MTKRGWKELMQGLYENHFDSGKDEELRKSKTEVENKLPKIIKLVKEVRLNKRNRNTELLLKKESELIGLIEDFHKQYQFVYGQYDDFRGKLSETANEGKEGEGFFTTTSSSESDKNIKTDNGHLDRQQKKSFYSEYIEAVNKAKENEKTMQELQEKLDEKGREISSLARMQKLHQREVSGLMKKLESELSSYNHKLDGMCPEKKESEQQAENKDLLSQVSKLEEIAKEMVEKNGVESAVEENEVSKIKGLMIQVNCLKLNVDCLFNARKIDSEKQKLHLSNDNNNIGEKLVDQVNEMKSDVGLMREKNTELESSFKMKIHENTAFLSKIDGLKKEVTGKGQELQKIQKEKEDSLMRVKSLELEAQISSNYRSETEKIIAIKEQEIEELQGKIVNMEKVLKEKEDQFTALQNRLESAPINHEQEIELKNESEIQTKSKNSDISNLTDEKESLKGRILELEKKLENQNDQQSMIKQQEDTINKLKEDCQLMKGRHLQAANRKMDEVAEEFRKNFEDQLRMLTRRVRVAELLQAETKENCKKIQEHCQQQHPTVREKRPAHHQVQLQTVVHQAVKEMMKEMDLLISNFKSKEGSFLQRLSSMSNEIHVATNWVRSTMNEIKPCKNNEQLGSPCAFTVNDKEQDKVMKEKVKKLEARVNKEKGDKLRLMRGMYEMQKKVSDLENAILEKDEGLSRLGNEKVEAIRQLCIWNDYQQSQFDQLKKVMLVKKTKS